MAKSEFLSAPFLILSAIGLCASTASAAFFLYPEHLRGLGMPSREIGFVMSGFFVGAVLGVPLAGRLATAFSRESLCLAGLLTLAVAALLLFFSISAWLSFLGRTLQGVGWTAVQISTMVMATARAPDKTAQAAAILGLGFIVGQGVGPLLVSTVSGQTAAALFWLSALFALVPCTGLLALRGVPGTAKEYPRPLHVRVPLRAVAVPVAATCLLNAPFLTAVSLIADHASIVGIARDTSGFFVAFVGSSIACRLSLSGLLNSASRPLVIAVSGVVASAALLMLSRLDSAWGLWLAGALFGLANSGYIPTLQALLIDRLDDRVRAVSLFRLTMELSGALAIISGGLVADRFGYPLLFAIAAGVAAMGWVIILVERRRY